MLERLRHTRGARWILALFVFVVLGYFSNAVSVDGCKRTTDRWMKQRLVGNDWPGRHALSKPASYTYPWIVAVDYEYVAGDLGGEWGTRYYLCILGIPIPIRNHIGMVS